MYVIAFSWSIALYSLTHSIAFVIVLLFIVWGRWYYARKNIVALIAMLILACLSVIAYDWRSAGSFYELIDAYYWYEQLYPSIKHYPLLIQERDRMGRYIVETVFPVDEKVYDKNFTFLLYSSQLLRPWDLVMTTQLPIWRKNIFADKGGQSWQDVDTASLLIKDSQFNYDRWLYMQGIDGSLYDNNAVVVDTQELYWLSWLREQFYQKIQTKYWQEKTKNTIAAWLVVGMTIGDRSLIDKEWYQQFIDSGLVHLIAVSGWNIAIVVMFVGLLLFWLPFYIRQAFLLLSVLAYAMIVGNDSSVIRAAIMGSLTILALFPGRQISLWRSMAYARVWMLLRNPYFLLYDLWFGLSFAALSGIVVLTRLFEEYEAKKKQAIVAQKKEFQEFAVVARTYAQKFLNYCLHSYIVPTLGATLWVVPLLLRSMEQTNILSPFINFFAVPFVPLITLVWFFLPLIPQWTRLDTLYFLMIDWIVRLSIWWREYGVYISMSITVKNIFLCLWLCWWVRVYVRVSNSLPSLPLWREEGQKDKSSWVERRNQ